MKMIVHEPIRRKAGRWRPKFPPDMLTKNEAARYDKEAFVIAFCLAFQVTATKPYFGYTKKHLFCSLLKHTKGNKQKALELVQEASR